MKSTPIENKQMWNFDNKEPLSRKMKTIQSIGTFNQTPEQIQRSFIVQQKSQVYNKPFSLEDKQKDPLNISNITKLSKIQGELIDISKMKNMYESRLQRDRFKNSSSNRSIQKYSAGKSAEKHILKPTNTPNFNKFENKRNSKQIQQSKTKTKGNQRSIVFMKNIEAEEINQNQGLQLTTRNEQQFLYQFYPQSSVKKKLQILAEKQSSSKHRDYSKRISFDETKKQLQLSDIKIENLNSKDEFIQIKNVDCKCNCDKRIFNFIDQIEAKLIEAFQRIKNLQQKNIQAQKKAQQVQRINLLREEQIIKMQEEKERLQESESNCRIQKQQLELMLKDILFKRERQKLQQSKQNTHRHSTSQNQYLYSNQNTPPTFCLDYNKRSPINNEKYPIKQKKAQNKDRSTKMSQNRAITIKTNQKMDSKDKNQNKNRIESLLQKLQINVQRTSK